MFKNLKYSSRTIGICILVLFAFYMFIVSNCLSSSDLNTIIIFESISVIIEFSIFILLMIYVFSLLFNKGNELLLLAGISKAKIYFSAMIPNLTFLLIFISFQAIRKYVTFKKISELYYENDYKQALEQSILINSLLILMFAILFSMLLLYKSEILKAMNKNLKIIVVESILIILSLILAFIFIYSLTADSNLEFINQINMIYFSLFIYLISFIILINDVFIYRKINL